MLSPSTLHYISLGGYKPVKELGRGAFGVAYLCRNSQGRMCCLKSIRLDGGEALANATSQQRSEYRHSVQREIYLLSNLQHPRIVRCDEHFEVNAHMYIAMEYLEAGNLQALIDRRQRYFTASVIVRYLCDMLSGVEYLHMKHVIHQDLKPENILMGRDGRLRIADFGLSRIHTDVFNHVRQPGADGGGTPMFMAPETIYTGEHSFESDIWALGCILHELCTLRSPFYGCRSVEEIYAKAFKRPTGRVSALAKNWERPYAVWFQELVDGMLAPDAAKRMSIAKLVAHPALTVDFYGTYFDYNPDFATADLTSSNFF